jgi:hypothetical protein
MKIAERLLLRCLNLQRSVGFLDRVKMNKLHRFASIHALAAGCIFMAFRRDDPAEAVA